MIKVCHLTSVHNVTDGRIFYKECVSLAGNGYEVYLVAPNAQDMFLRGVHVVGVPLPKCGRLKRIFRYSSQVCKKALSIDADIYHLHDPELLQYVRWFKKRGKKVIYDMHEDYPLNIMTKLWIPFLFRRLISWIYVRYETKALKCLDGVVIVTPQMGRRLSYVKRIKLVTNYPLTDGFSNNDENSNYLDRGNVLAFAGTIAAERMHHNLIKAIENIEDVTYILAGKSNPYLESLKHLPAWKKVVYLGVITKEEVDLLYRKTKIGIIIEDYCPVNYNNEGSLGVTKLFEYMKHSIPCICTNFKYHKEIVDKHNCGICINPLNVNEISDAIVYLLNHPEEAKNMGKNGYRAYLEKYNWKSQEDELLDLYKEINLVH